MGGEDEIRKSNKEKINYFYSNNIKVHITKRNREFLNGWVVKKVSDGVYKIKDDKINKTIYLFLSEIWSVEQWVPKPKEDDKDE